MAEIQLRTVTFPESARREQNSQVECEQVIVVVGANGAGKSRLGAWLETAGPQRESVFRIAAQRSLVFPTSVSPIGYQSAVQSFLWAEKPANWTHEQFEANKLNMRLQRRYGNVSDVQSAPVNDFDMLVKLLFSENYDKLLSHEEAQSRTESLVPIPPSRLRQVQSLWGELLPHRRLHIRASEVRVSRVSDSLEYAANVMSDGERVIFYLVGQCLSAPEGAIIVVDEPEIHLHKAIQNRLWDVIERERPDCTFVYLTHDVMFASDRAGATKICVTEVGESAFDWFVVASDDDIPDDVLLEVVGSRKPVLFVEGEHGSIDAALYRAAYPNYTVKPVGSCAAVVAATKAFRARRELHRLECYGLVDRDYLQEGQLEAYADGGVFALEVAEAENLCLVPEVVLLMAARLLCDPPRVLDQVKRFVIEEFARRIRDHAMGVTRHAVALRLGRFSSAKPDLAQFAQDLSEHLSGIDANSIYLEAIAQAGALIDAHDYAGVLRVFNRKELVSMIQRFFDITRLSYVDRVAALAKTEPENVREALGGYLPSLRQDTQAS